MNSLLEALEDIPDPCFCEGTAQIGGRLAVMLPNGETKALCDRTFVNWLVRHSEDAPFGEAGQTRIDKKVRNARRLIARSEATVTGFDPGTILAEIEAALSPRLHLEARLEDILVYSRAGRFLRHKDTPRSRDLLGTLIVGLPIAHKGGEFEVVDGGQKHEIDWSGESPDTGSVRWVAFFSDVDHAIAPIKSGSRVTLVYSLTRSRQARIDAVRDKRIARLRDEISKITPSRLPLMVACSRLIITDGEQPQSIDTLRGADREIAEIFLEAGFSVAVRGCIATDYERATSNIATLIKSEKIQRIRKLRDSMPQGLEFPVSLAHHISDDDDDDEWLRDNANLLGQYIDDIVDAEFWIFRERAAATLAYEGVYTETGYLGNEGGFGHIYSLAAIEVTSPPPASGKRKKR